MILKEVLFLNRRIAIRNRIRLIILFRFRFVKKILDQN